MTQKWEYVTVPLLVHATKQILDNWGDEGWELVAVVSNTAPNAAPNTAELAIEGQLNLLSGALSARVLPGAAPAPPVQQLVAYLKRPKQ